MSSEIVRKSVHIILALVFIVIGPSLGPLYTATLGGALLVAFAVSRLIRRMHFFHEVPRTSYGEFFFAMGIISAALLFLPTYPQAYIGGLLVLGFADTLAALIGTRYGHHQYRLWGDKKSLEGSMAAAIGAGGILVFLGMPVLTAFVGGLALAFIEAGTPRGGDNLLLPVVTGLILVLV